MKLPRRQVEVFSLSFLDCICCGFGAMILLLVLTEIGDPIQLERSRKDLDAQIMELQKQLYVIRGESDTLNRELQGRVEKLEKEKRAVAQLSGDLTDVRGQFDASRQEASVTNTIESELVAAYQTLTAEMQRLLKEKPKPREQTAIGGIPVDSEYIIFIIDTSASMLGNHWDEARDVLREILDIYPTVKGLQIMDDEGKVMIPATRGRWLNDSPGMRDELVRNMRLWRSFSNSNPVEGIEEAIRVYWAADKRISLYVIGDEFTGDSYQQALNEVAQVNKPDAAGRRRVRIHAVGFPEGKDMTAFTNIKFSALMRMMCEQNNGTFVGITG
jgi:hypothetical protein